jgi:hypothetical protein
MGVGQAGRVSRDLGNVTLPYRPATGTRYGTALRADAAQGLSVALQVSRQLARHNRTVESQLVHPNRHAASASHLPAP